ncbi:MAG: hypothetical protein HC865_18980 [Cyanobacteria bacterium RU_5_0]|nr:hypothetical protein [Cyanobacteria bacterium RU_5_0]
MDLKIQSARLSEHAGFWDIAIDRGIIIQIASSIPVSAKTTLDANGKLVVYGINLSTLF